MGRDNQRGRAVCAVRSQGRRLGWVVALALAGLLAAIGPTAAQAQNGITSPQPGDTIDGVVLIEGTATDPAFLRYELALNRGDEWIVFAGGGREVQQGTLAVWDTTVGYPGAPVFPDGVYQLRLRVVRQDYNYDEYFAGNLVLANSQATPTATATPPVDATPQATATPPAGDAGDVAEPTPLPSLTPFPTPTAPATAAGIVAGGAGQPPATAPETEGGLAARLQAIDSSQFSRAFWQGARWALYAFGALAAYLLLRAVGRRLWRLLLTYVESGGGDR
jgi:hypothetical protein